VKRLSRKISWGAAVCLLLALCLSAGWAQSPGSQTPAPQTPAKKTAQPANPTSPTDPEIASAKAQGKVWVNLDTKIYHRGGRWYGKTKNGKFMTEDEAKAAGFRPSHTT
jgi:hypothetical protein